MSIDPLRRIEPVHWPPLWSGIEAADKSAFEAELKRELKPGHPLFGIAVSALARRHDQDDVLFELLDGSGCVAEVHLTWAGQREQPPWPGTLLAENLASWTASADTQGAF